MTTAVVLARNKANVQAFYDLMFNEPWDVLQIVPDTSANDNGML